MTIVRGQKVMAFPTRFMLVAASNPCPCGMGDDDCRCTAADLARHHRRLSGPLLDRIDVLVAVGRPRRRGAARRAGAVLGRRPRARRRRPRAPGRPPRPPRPRPATRRCPRGCCASTPRPRPSALRLLYELHDRHRLTARGHGRVLRVARTLADLDEQRHRRPRAHHPRRRPPPRDGRPGRRGMTAAAAGVDAARGSAACDACLRRTALIAALVRAARRGVAPARRHRARARAARRGAARARARGRAGARTSGFDAAARARARPRGPRVALVCRCVGAPTRRGCARCPTRRRCCTCSATPRRSDVPDAVAIVGARRATAYGLEVSRALGRGLSRGRRARGLRARARGRRRRARGRAGGPAAAGRGAGRRRRRPVPAEQPRCCTRRSPSAARSCPSCRPASSAFRWCFVARNRIIAALAQVVVIVEAAERSGSLTTADFAADLGCTVAAVPGRVTQPHRRRHERPDPDRRRARARRRRRARPARRRDRPARAASRPARPPPDLEPELRALLAAVEEGRGALGELASGAGGGPGRARRARRARVPRADPADVRRPVRAPRRRDGDAGRRRTSTAAG